MPHIHIPEIFITQEEYDMIQDNQVPIDVFVANTIRDDKMFVYIQETDCTYKRAQNYSWNPELDSRKLSENPDNHFPISDT